MATEFSFKSNSKKASLEATTQTLPISCDSVSTETERNSSESTQTEQHYLKLAETDVRRIDSRVVEMIICEIEQFQQESKYFASIERLNSTERISLILEKSLIYNMVVFAPFRLSHILFKF